MELEKRLVDLTVLHGAAGVAHRKLPVKHKTSQTECSQMTTFKVALSMCGERWESGRCPVDGHVNSCIRKGEMSRVCLWYSKFGVSEYRTVEKEAWMESL